MNIDKDIGENPTPKQVRDYYDLHTAEGAANFSNENSGITVQLWHSLAQALEDNAELLEALELVHDYLMGNTDKIDIRVVKQAIRKAKS